MAKTFDFNKLKEKTLKVVLTDPENTTLVLKTPNKKLFEYLKRVQDDIKNVEEHKDCEELFDSLYDVTAKIMSHNKEGIEITPEKLKELYDEIEYIYAFLEAYTDFIKDYHIANNSKN